MEKFKYVTIENRYFVASHENRYAVYNLGEYCPDLAKKYKIMMAHKHDLARAFACLDQMSFTQNTSLIDDALINTAIQLLVKCFSNQAGKGRNHLDSKRVFRTFSKQIGEDDLTLQFLKFYDARNKVISHDQMDFYDNLIGVTIDVQQDIAVDITDITIRTTYLHKQNQVLLKRIISVAQKYVNSQLEEIKKKLIEWYNSNDTILSLSPLEHPNVARTNSW